jgi:hypothetical protein
VKKRSFKQDISKSENMGYDEKNDTYTCHNGKLLKPVYIKNQKSKKLSVSKTFIARRQESYENIFFVKVRLK